MTRTRPSPAGRDREDGPGGSRGPARLWVTARPARLRVTARPARLRVTARPARLRVTARPARRA
jgi:hypothetical protein